MAKGYRNCVVDYGMGFYWREGQTQGVRRDRSRRYLRRPVQSVLSVSGIVMHDEDNGEIVWV